MTAIEQLFQQPAAQAIGWALLQFVWQGALVGVLSAAALLALKRSAADVRYVVATIGLTLMLTMPAVTAVQTWRSMTDESSTASASVSVAPVDVAPRTSELSELRRESPSATADALRFQATPDIGWVRLVLLTWLSGVVILTIRLLAGWAWVRRLKSRGTSPATGGWEQIAFRLSRQLHISRPIRLLESALVEVPTVIGWLRPVVLMPASALSGMGPQQVEAILAHELAHIRRHDYLVNLLQTLVETLLFYHPAVWWLSHRIRIERENCCDDLAVSLCGDPYAYAKALADLEELRGDSAPLVLAANGGSLLLRIRRLIGTPSHAGRGPGWLAGSTAVVLIAGIAAGAVGQNGTVEQVDASAVIPATTPALAPEAPDVSAPVRAAAPTPVRGAASASEVTPVVARASTVRSDTAPVVTPAIAVGEAVASFVAEVLEQFYWSSPPVPPAPPVPPTPPTAPTPPTPPLPPVMGSLEQPPAPPEPPTPPMPPAPPAPPTEPFGFERSGQSSGNFMWSDGNQKLEVRYLGSIEFTDDDSDVKTMSPGALVRIKEGGWLSSRAVEFRADSSGTIERRYWDGRTEKPFVPDGKAWLSQILPKVIRQTGFGAEKRVARILKAKGPAGVLAEINLIEGSYAKRIYFAELLKTPLDSATVRQALDQAGRQIDSDFELASLLKSSTGLLADDATRRAYFDAARSISSDFEMRGALSAALQRGPVSPEILAGVLDASTSIDSDFEEASLLEQVAKLQPLDDKTRAPFLKALVTVASDFERRRVVTAVVKADPTPGTLATMLDPSVSISSDFEQASFLLEVAKLQAVDGPLRDPFFKAVSTIDSSFERGRVLQAVAKRPNLTPETLVAVLRSAQGMGGSFETGQVLQTVIATQKLSGEARDIYVTTAERLGDFEQGRALTALVKAERR